MARTIFNHSQLLLLLFAISIQPVSAALVSCQMTNTDISMPAGDHSHHQMDHADNDSQDNNRCTMANCQCPGHGCMMLSMMPAPALATSLTNQVEKVIENAYTSRTQHNNNRFRPPIFS